MKNEHSTSGIAEDIIRSFVQLSVTEMHLKTLIEKRISEIENGLIDIDDSVVVQDQYMTIHNLKTQCMEVAQMRRDDMLYLYELFGSKGNKEMWCLVKHLGISMMCAFEAWQASDNNYELLEMALKKNKMFILCMTEFLGVEITQCAACFADIMKGA